MAPCGTGANTEAGYPIMDSNRVRILTYKFSKPVTDIELFFAEFGYSQSAGLYDYADIELRSHGTVVPISSPYVMIVPMGRQKQLRMVKSDWLHYQERLLM